jgi:hypothetical protein
LIKFVQPHILALLSPEHIMNHESIGFIPKDKNFPTRYVGSWVCVCVSAALLMVLLHSSRFFVLFFVLRSSFFAIVDGGGFHR